MKKRHPRCLVIAFALLLVLFSSLALMGELTARLVESPESSALYVNLDSVTVDGNALSTISLSVRNDSTNLLAIDVSRSALLLPDGTAYPLSAFLKSDLGATLMPGNSASGTIGVSAPVQSGNRLDLFLAWTLGAVVTHPLRARPALLRHRNGEVGSIDHASGRRALRPHWREGAARGDVAGSSLGEELGRSTVGSLRLHRWALGRLPLR